MSAVATLRRSIAAAALAATLGASAASASPPPATCCAGWSDALPVVQREALASVSELHADARRQKLGDLVRITLCSDQGRFVYHLLVREPQGRVVPMVVDAHHPFSP